MKKIFGLLLFSMLLGSSFADEIFPRKGFDGFSPDQAGGNSRGPADRGERGNAHGPEMDFRNIKFEYIEGDKLFKNTDEAKEYQTLYDKNKDSKEIKNFFESLEKTMKEKMQTMMKSGERPDMAKMKIEREEDQKQLSREMKGILEKKKNATTVGCAGSNQSKIIERPAIDSMNDAKKATSIVMTQEELAKMKADIAEEVKKEIMNDMPKPTGDMPNKMADRGDRRPPPSGESDDKDSPFTDSSSRLKKGKRPSQQSGGDDFMAGNSNMNSMGMGQNQQMQQGQSQNSQYQQQIMAQIQVPQMSYQMSQGMGQNQMQMMNGQQRMGGNNQRMGYSQQQQMPQYYSGQNISMSNGIGMSTYTNASNLGYSSPYNVYSQYGGNYQSQKNYGQNSMQQNPYMVAGYSQQQQMPQYYYGPNSSMSSGFGMSSYNNAGNTSYTSPNSAYLQYGGNYQMQSYGQSSMQQNPFAMMGQ